MAEQPSPPTVLPSSQASPASVTPSPQTGTSSPGSFGGVTRLLPHSSPVSDTRHTRPGCRRSCKHPRSESSRRPVSPARMPLRQVSSQVAEQPSPPTVLPSSQASPASVHVPSTAERRTVSRSPSNRRRFDEVVAVVASSPGHHTVATDFGRGRRSPEQFRLRRSCCRRRRLLTGIEHVPLPQVLVESQVAEQPSTADGVAVVADFSPRLEHAIAADCRLAVAGRRAAVAVVECCRRRTTSPVSTTCRRHRTRLRVAGRRPAAVAVDVGVAVVAASSPGSSTMPSPQYGVAVRQVEPSSRHRRPCCRRRRLRRHRRRHRRRPRRRCRSA